ncbi:hypothetical protein P3W83_21595, partial [Cupriavidus basilensis]|nr:hypothetical protein [Cupriavidus basilensis]
GGWHGSVGIYVGPGFGYGYGWGWGYPYSPYYYPPGYYYPPAVVGVPTSPPQYIEQGQDGTLELNSGTVAAPAPQQQVYWYHCARPDGYYPYIKACPGGWQKVPAQPPA